MRLFPLLGTQLFEVAQPQGAIHKLAVGETRQLESRLLSIPIFAHRPSDPDARVRVEVRTSANPALARANTHRSRHVCDIPLYHFLFDEPGEMSRQRLKVLSLRDASKAPVEHDFDLVIYLSHLIYQGAIKNVRGSESDNGGDIVEIPVDDFDGSQAEVGFGLSVIARNDVFSDDRLSKGMVYSEVWRKLLGVKFDRVFDSLPGWRLVSPSADSTFGSGLQSAKKPSALDPTLVAPVCGEYRHGLDGVADYSISALQPSATVEKKLAIYEPPWSQQTRNREAYGKPVQLRRVLYSTNKSTGIEVLVSYYTRKAIEMANPPSLKRCPLRLPRKITVVIDGDCKPANHDIEQFVARSLPPFVSMLHVKEIAVSVETPQRPFRGAVAADNSASQTVLEIERRKATSNVAAEVLVWAFILELFRRCECFLSLIVRQNPLVPAPVRELLEGKAVECKAGACDRDTDERKFQLRAINLLVGRTLNALLSNGGKFRLTMDMAEFLSPSTHAGWCQAFFRRFNQLEKSGLRITRWGQIIDTTSTGEVHDGQWRRQQIVTHELVLERASDEVLSFRSPYAEKLWNMFKSDMDDLLQSEADSTREPIFRSALCESRHIRSSLKKVLSDSSVSFRTFHDLVRTEAEGS